MLLSHYILALVPLLFGSVAAAPWALDIDAEVTIPKVGYKLPAPALTCADLGYRNAGPLLGNLRSQMHNTYVTKVILFTSFV
jgi:hypothetical protein